MCINSNCYMHEVYRTEHAEIKVPETFTHVLKYIFSTTAESIPKGLCGDVLVTPTGTIVSSLQYEHGYPYSNDMKCIWKISTDPNQRIALSVEDGSFDVEQGSDMFNCHKDHLDIYDGRGIDAVKLGSFCGKGMRKFESLLSTGSDLYLEFHTDSEGRKLGFKLHYITFPRSKIITV